MAREILVARDAGGQRVRFALDVFQEEERWTSVLARLDDDNRPLPTAVAPRFYGLTADQARRKMLSVLESQFEEIGVEAA